MTLKSCFKKKLNCLWSFFFFHISVYMRFCSLHNEPLTKSIKRVQKVCLNKAFLLEKPIIRLKDTQKVFYWRKHAGFCQVQQQPLTNTNIHKMVIYYSQYTH